MLDSYEIWVFFFFFLGGIEKIGCTLLVNMKLIVIQLTNWLKIMQIYKEKFVFMLHIEIFISIS